MKDIIHPYFYGLFLFRILHMIAAMQIKWPSKSILIGKTGMDAAYRHIRANSWIASTFISIVDNISLLCLRLPFGTTPAPANYTTVSEAEIEPLNDLLRRSFWDATEIQSMNRQLLEEE